METAKQKLIEIEQMFDYEKNEFWKSHKIWSEIILNFNSHLRNSQQRIFWDEVLNEYLKKYTK